MPEAQQGRAINESGVSLRDYLTSKIEASDKINEFRYVAADKAVASALAAAKEATTKAEIASDKRFDSVNEFRKTLADQARDLMPRLETEQSLRALTEKIDTLTSRVNAKDDRAKGLDAGWGYLAGGVGLVIAVISVVYTITH